MRIIPTEYKAAELRALVIKFCQSTIPLTVGGLERQGTVSDGDTATCFKSLGEAGWIGRRLAASSVTPCGDIDRPLSEIDFQANFHKPADPAIGHARAAEISKICAVLGTPDTDTFGRLLDLILAPA